MPKFGLKCFLGSFVFSLAAVLAVTKAYLFLPDASEQQQSGIENIETRDIELFAHNRENDPIRVKYEQLMSEENHEINITETEPIEDNVQQALIETEPTDDILFAPTDETENNVTVSDISADTVESQLGETKVETTTAEAEAELPIVDAAEATIFEIPLTHGFAPANSSDDNVAINNRAEGHQVALADESVKIDTLGVENKKAPIVNTGISSDEDDDPWEVAEVANKNITRNQNAETASTATSGNSVPYKMQKNILIPIPDEIANDKNLTPQFSSSAENIKLEQELRRKHGRPPLAIESDDVKAADAAVVPVSASATKEAANTTEPEDVSDDENNSLTDSIAAWFSGNRKKDVNNSGDGQNSSGGNGKTLNNQQESSLFRRLLGLGAASNGNIAPTELKLSFQANRAEISGQTLEWIKAFSENVVKYDDVAIEIRIDRSASYELQQKRLKLLYKILANNGVEYRKINIIFTDREPNSFIIRNVRYVTKEEKVEVATKSKSPWY